uniref:Cubilin-like n=1 Tax=Saccoglossus kowalevskii TaxID=10224 RepID=A0ABM0GUA9_SACKO|nr:PREDICTED: cubilin-like [Saccoglossus kowalevskii]
MSRRQLLRCILSALACTMVLLPVRTDTESITDKPHFNRIRKNIGRRDIDGYCGAYNRDSGVIKSPNYPSNYPSNQDCYYYISVTSGMFVQLVFYFFNTEEFNDYVDIYDGPSESYRRIGSYSGSTIPPIITSSGATASITVYFHSDGENQLQGFEATFKAVARPNVACVGTFYGSEGVFSSPNFPGFYPSNQDCYYTITASVASAVIQIEFLQFATEENYDYVSIYDGTSTAASLLGTYSGLKIPLVPVSTRSTITVYFHSDGSNEFQGFNATFQQVNTTTYSYFVSDYGFIASPGFPNYYPSNQDCYYFITVSKGMYVQLVFTTFSTESIHDYVEIYDGPSPASSHLGFYSGNSPPSVPISSGNTITVYFHSDGIIERQGFNATYRAVITTNVGDCGGTFNSDMGVIATPNYPDHYPGNQDCYYYIRVSDGLLIQLEFILFNTEYEHDFVSVFDGSSTSSTTILNSYSGSGLPLVPFSSGSSLTVYFHSNADGAGQGFYAKFKTVLMTNNTGSHCGGTFTTDWGIFTSQNYPEHYSTFLDCYYYITVTAGNKIQVQFNIFDTESCCDYICIYDGSSTSSLLLGNYTGSTLPPLITSNWSHVLIYFHTDGTVGSRGFQAVYTSQPPKGFSVCTNNLATSLGGVIYSHDTYPDDYQSSPPCSLAINTFAYYANIYLKFVDIDMYTVNDHDCLGGDYIILSRSSVGQYTICHPNDTADMYITSGAFEISTRFTEPTHPRRYRGFKAVYSLYYYAGTHGNCTYASDFKCDNNRCIAGSLRCDGNDNCGDNTDEEACGLKDDAALIIGGALGGLVLVVTVVVLVVVLYRKRIVKPVSLNVNGAPPPVFTAYNTGNLGLTDEQNGVTLPSDLQQSTVSYRNNKAESTPRSESPIYASPIDLPSPMQITVPEPPPDLATAANDLIANVRTVRDASADLPTIPTETLIQDSPEHHTPLDLPHQMHVFRTDLLASPVHDSPIDLPAIPNQDQRKPGPVSPLKDPPVDRPLQGQNSNRAVEPVYDSPTHSPLSSHTSPLHGQMKNHNTHDNSSSSTPRISMNNCFVLPSNNPRMYRQTSPADNPGTNRTASESSRNTTIVPSPRTPRGHVHSSRTRRISQPGRKSKGRRAMSPTYASPIDAVTTPPMSGHCNNSFDSSQQNESQYRPEGNAARNSHRRSREPITHFLDLTPTNLNPPPGEAPPPYDEVRQSTSVYLC